MQIIQHNAAQQSGQDNNRFDPITGVITWDPFLAAFGNNLNGSPYSQSPIMALAHELVYGAHRYNPAYQGADNEAIIMQITNQIATEMNAATQSSYSTDRDNDVRTHQGDVTSVTSAEYSIGSRPACD